MNASTASARPWWAFDPLGYTVELPLSGAFCPLGFPLALATNSRDVLLAAEESWGGFPQFFPEPPIQVNIGVPETSFDAHATSFRVRGRDHLISMISDEHNFAICDVKQGYSFGFMTPATVADRAWFRYFYLESIANLMLWNTHLTRIHAACVARGDKGVLLCGDSGAGKSCLAYACARAGWTFISDEAPSIMRRCSERIVIGKPHQIHFREPAFDLFPELRGRPVKPNPVGKISFEVNTSEIPKIKTGYRIGVTAVVFLKRGEEVPARLVPLAREEAWRRLEADLPMFPEPAHQEHVASLQNMVTAQTFDLCYRDFDGAINQLETLVR